MGLFRKRDRRPLPHYFEKDQVGGLSHLLSISLGQHSQGYADKLMETYDHEYSLTCYIGTIILAQPNNGKYEVMDELLTKYYPNMPDSERSDYQGLLSLFIYRALVPIRARPELARMLFRGERSLNRAYSYIDEIFFPAERMADEYLRSIGIEVERDPITPSDLLK